MTEFHCRTVLAGAGAVAASAVIGQAAHASAQKSINDGDRMTIKLSKDNLPILDQFSEGDFVDCVFRIERLSDEGNYYAFQMRASFNDECVGVDVRLVKELRQGFDHEMNLIQDHVYKKGVCFLR